MQWTWRVFAAVRLTPAQNVVRKDHTGHGQAVRNRSMMPSIVLVALLAGIPISGPVQAKSTESLSQAQFFGTGLFRCPLVSLANQGFSGPMGRGVTIRYLGQIPARKHEYLVYSHYFVNPESNHGHMRILVMGRGCIYAGHYYVMARPLGVRGNAVMFDAPKFGGNVIRFRHRMLPRVAWIDGEIHPFTR